MSPYFKLKNLSSAHKGIVMEKPTKSVNEKMANTRKTVTQILIKRLSILISIVILIALTLYVVGNYQNFLDDTQFLLINSLDILGILLCIVALYGFVLSVRRMVKQKHAGAILGSIMYFVVELFAISVVAFSSLVGAITRY
jgi:hypothetical protein